MSDLQPGETVTTHFSGQAIDPGCSMAEFRRVVRDVVEHVFEHTSRREIDLDLSTFKVEVVPAGVVTEHGATVHRPPRVMATVDGVRR